MYGIKMNTTMESVLSEGHLRILLPGDKLDATNAEELKTTLLELIVPSVEQVTIDLGNVSFIDSSGVGVLLACNKSFRAFAGNKQIVLSRVQTPVAGIISLLRLNRVFEVQEG